MQRLPKDFLKGALIVFQDFTGIFSTTYRIHIFKVTGYLLYLYFTSGISLLIDYMNEEEKIFNNGNLELVLWEFIIAIVHQYSELLKKLMCQSY